MIAVLDNYDSFTYNLVHAIAQMGCPVEVVRNDQAEAMQIMERAAAIVFSPGPGLPQEAGCLMQAAEFFSQRKPVLGVCLGMQALALVNGGQLEPCPQPRHGIPMKITSVDPSSLWFSFKGHSGQSVGLYHSWRLKSSGNKEPWKITVWDQEGVPMAMENPSGTVLGVQFHPESIMTPWGESWIKQWAVWAGKYPQ